MDKKRKQLVEYCNGALGGIQAQARALVSADRLQIALDAIANAHDKLSNQKWAGSLRHLCSESQSGVKITTQNILQTIFNISDADYKARFAPITDGTNAVLQGHIDKMVEGFLQGVIPIYSVDCKCEDIFVGDTYTVAANEACTKTCGTGSGSASGSNSGSASASASGSATASASGSSSASVSGSASVPVVVQVPKPVEPVKTPDQAPPKPIEPIKVPVQAPKPVEPVKVPVPAPVQPIKAPVPAPVKVKAPVAPKPKKNPRKTRKSTKRRGKRSTRRSRRNRRNRVSNAWKYFYYADKVWGPDNEEFFLGDSFDVAPYDDKIIKGN
jgi:hypothetical protein